jgi:hypothetical protein
MKRVNGDQLQRMSKRVPRPTRGRPRNYPLHSYSFCAFILVHSKMEDYRDKFGVKRVPQAVTDELINAVVELLPEAKKRTIRRHLRNDRRMLPSTARSKT